MDKRKSNPLANVLWLTIGILRDYQLRRWAMFYLILAAVAILFVGSTLLMGWLREHPFLFLGYWGACAWLTLTAVLLAVYDMAAVRKSAIEEKNRLKKEMASSLESDES